MKHILDTHVILWFLNGERLSPKVREKIMTGENFVSVVSLWEVAIKMNIGKYSFVGGFSAFCELVRDNGFEILPIKDEHMQGVFVLPFIHKDPFDRLIIATAKYENMSLITADESIHQYDVDWIW
jgi:PIN domain nuclease of toxin-antitoxin system